MKIPNKHCLVLPLLTAITALSSNAQAKADNGFVTVPNKLQQADYYHAPRQAQLVDERMRVKNFVLPDAPAENAVFAIPPYANGVPGSSAGVKMVGNTLPQSRFSSQIPAGGITPARALPQTKMGGITPIAPARHIGLKPNNLTPTIGKPLAASKTVSATPITAEYAKSARPSSSNFSFEQRVNAEVRADLRSHK